MYKWFEDLEPGIKSIGTKPSIPPIWLSRYTLFFSRKMKSFSTDFIWGSKTAAAVLLPQIKSVENDFILREKNRVYLDSQIGGIDGFVPIDLIPGSRSSNHLYMVRYLKEEFNDISLYH